MNACRAVLCREEAQELQKAKPQLDKLGVKLVGIVKEWDEAEIKVRSLRAVLTASGGSGCRCSNCHCALGHACLIGRCVAH